MMDNCTLCGQYDFFLPELDCCPACWASYTFAPTSCYECGLEVSLAESDDLVLECWYGTQELAAIRHSTCESFISG